MIRQCCVRLLKFANLEVGSLGYRASRGLTMPLNLLAITWDIASVEEAGYSTWSSLAFSPSGQPAIAYSSSLKHALRFAEQDSHGALVRNSGGGRRAVVGRAFRRCAATPASRAGSSG